jgi:general secretion pathway protein N
LLIGRLDARIEHDSMAQPVQLSGRIGEWHATPGALMLPAMSLERLGSPWTTIRPTGSLAITWDALTVRDGRFEGRVAIELSHAASALTPVRPLGAYRVQVVGSGSQADLTMHTLSGPLLLEGKGRWNARSGLQFLAEARAEESEKLRLMPLLGLLGRREGERTLIKIGA